MNKKLIFLDVDGTLVAAFKGPSALVAEAVRGARENGHRVVLCTGRNMPIIGSDIMDIGFVGVIASAGSHVEVAGNVLFDQLLAEEVIQECLSVFHAHGIYCRLETEEGIYSDPEMEALVKTAKADRRNSELIRMQQEFKSRLSMQPYEKYPGRGAYKVCFTGTSMESIEQTKEILGDRFSYAVHAFASSKDFFNGEIIPKEIGKGRGVELVRQYYGVDRSDTVAFGDSMNDYEMMEAVGVSVAMGNACDELKSMADRICEEVSEDGIYHEFSRMGLL